MLSHSFETTCVQGRLSYNEPNCSRLPIYTSNTYKKDSYARYKNPNRLLLEDTFCKLYSCDKKPNIPKCNSVSSGLGAFAAILQSGSRYFKDKNKIIADKEMYDEVVKLLQFFDAEYDISWVDMNDSEQSYLKDELNDTTKFVFTDSRPFPHYHHKDIKTICSIVHANAPYAKVVVDNSNWSCYNYNPFTDGADVVVESLGKYCCGHGDAMGGVILNLDCSAAIDVFGNGIDPFSAWLISRGMSTMSIRMEKSMQSAKLICDYLKNDLGVSEVNLCAAVMTFLLPGNRDFDKLSRILRSASLIRKEYSFGQDNTSWMVETVTGKNHIRLSVGLEDPKDIINDIENTIGKHIR